MNNRSIYGLVGLALVLSLLAAPVSFLALRAARAPTEPAAADGTAKLDRDTATLVPPASQELVKHAVDDESAHTVQASIRLPCSEIPATKESLESEATYVADQLVNLLPDQAISLHVLAMLKAQLHQTAEAEQLWQRCVELDASTEPYYVNLAAILLDRGKSELAVEVLKQALHAGLASQDLSHHLGLALNSVGKSEEAIEVAEKSLATNPNAGALWLILGQAQLQLGLNAQAETSLRQAVQLGINSKAAYFSLFNACMRLGKREEAAEFRERYSAFKEKELSAEERYQVLSEAEARRICVSVLMESAAIYRAIPDLQTAEHLLLRVVALDPGNRAACDDLAKIYAERGELGNEIVVRERIIELDATNLLNYLRLAKTYVSADLPQQAEAQIKLAISYSPQMVTGYAAMAEFLMEQQQPAEAQWYVEQAIRLKPSPQGFELLAKSLNAQGKDQEANSAREVGREVTRQMSESAAGKQQQEGKE